MNIVYDRAIFHRFNNLPQVRELKQRLETPSNETDYLFTILRNDHLNGVPSSEYRLELVVENQRGMKVLGIPLYSGKTLIPKMDPTNFQQLSGDNLYLLGDLSQFPLSDFGWEWTWPEWYVLMASDVDEEGWVYSRLFFASKHWKGKHYMGHFIRRRVWIRLRNKVPATGDVKDEIGGQLTVNA
ncbi:uncharacterized protein KQ657_002567 [Scheffersomyces spartinae]|uniref:Peroxin/Ferlin domain-containing protein n=1 Tax=Scheffersomyces spartinae TaxID=45513 RepID=A0A9P7V667_9ASCO|nr:uncharacterized protein KQ657_002567 [Scheffersomyces spartinae]KAG7191961.1 hypothetical protein KQ657_002567 [Scheffersomyces spartinae]